MKSSGARMIRSSPSPIPEKLRLVFGRQYAFRVMAVQGGGDEPQILEAVPAFGRGKILIGAACRIHGRHIEGAAHRKSAVGGLQCPKCQSLGEIDGVGGLQKCRPVACVPGACVPFQ